MKGDHFNENNNKHNKAEYVNWSIKCIITLLCPAREDVQGDLMNEDIKSRTKWISNFYGHISDQTDQPASLILENRG